MIVDVSAKFESVFLYGFVLFVFNVLFGICSVVNSINNRKARSRQSQMNTYSCKYCLGIISLGQIIMAMVIRNSHGGSVCSADLIRDMKTGKLPEYIAGREFYLINEGFFMLLAAIL